MKFLKAIFQYFVNHLFGRHSDLRTFAINFPSSYIVPLVLMSLGTYLLELEILQDYDSTPSIIFHNVMVIYMTLVERSLIFLPVWGALGAAVRFFRRLFTIWPAPTISAVLTLPLIGLLAFVFNIAVFFVFPGEFLLVAFVSDGMYEKYPEFFQQYEQIQGWAWGKANEAMEEIDKLFGLEEFENG